MFDHVYWKAYGTRSGYRWGQAGLDTLGRLNDSTPMALAIGEEGEVSNEVYNRAPYDTTRHFQFPGSVVIPGSMNGDAYPDFVCYNQTQQRVTVFFGTARPDSFVTALVLQGKGHAFEALSGHIVVLDVEGAGHDDVVITDPTFEDSARNAVGRMLWYRGGQVMDSMPHATIVGHPFGGIIGGRLLVGQVQMQGVRELYELRLLGPFNAEKFDRARVCVCGHWDLAFRLVLGIHLTFVLIRHCMAHCE
jgi:hypothetical protein